MSPAFFFECGAGDTCRVAILLREEAEHVRFCAIVGEKRALSRGSLKPVLWYTLNSVMTSIRQDGVVRWVGLDIQ